jgi:hypothetical protein
MSQVSILISYIIYNQMYQVETSQAGKITYLHHIYYSCEVAFPGSPLGGVGAGPHGYAACLSGRFPWHERAACGVGNTVTNTRSDALSA